MIYPEDNRTIAGLRNAPSAVGLGLALGILLTLAVLAFTGCARTTYTPPKAAPAAPAAPARVVIPPMDTLGVKDSDIIVVPDNGTFSVDPQTGNYTVTDANGKVIERGNVNK